MHIFFWHELQTDITLTSAGHLLATLKLAKKHIVYWSALQLAKK